MNAPNVRDLERLDELLAAEASAALESSDAPELAALLEANPGVARDELIKAAGLAQVAFLLRAQRVAQRSAQRSGTATGARTGYQMPASLRDRLASQGEALTVRQRGKAIRLASNTPQGLKTEGSAQPISAAKEMPSGRSGASARLGWALAAALAVALVVVRNEAPVVSAPDGIPADPAPVDAVAARVSLVNNAPDVITLPWAPPAAEGYQAVTGDVVWSQSRQQGYLRLANMPVNDPGRIQYQLWIVDPDRDKHPVDGGVFNVGAAGEVVIPIQAKLAILAPTAFAITAERPGGVVVSAGPLLVVASI